jgi:hypothetical protein
MLLMQQPFRTLVPDYFSRTITLCCFSRTFSRKCRHSFFMAFLEPVQKPVLRVVSRAYADICYSSCFSRLCTCCSCCFLSLCRHLLLMLFFKPMQTFVAQVVSRAYAETCFSSCLSSLCRHLLLMLFLEPMQKSFAYIVFRATAGTFFWIPP